MSDALKSLVKPLEHSAPSVARALNEAPDLAVKALAECTGGACEAKPEQVHQALMGLPLGNIVSVVLEAERVLSALIAPASETTQPAAPDAPQAGPLDQALGGEKLVGLKTVIGIVAYVAVNIASGLGVVPWLLTPDVLTALNTLIGGLIGIGVIAKIDRYLAWLRPSSK